MASPFTLCVGKLDCSMACSDAGSDGIMDLMLKFDTEAVVAILGGPADGACAVRHLTGRLRDSSAVLSCVPSPPQWSGCSEPAGDCLGVRSRESCAEEADSLVS